MADELEQLRAEIDEIDKTRAELFVKRMQTVAKIGAFKRENGLPTVDKTREAEVLKQARTAVPPEFSDYFARLQQEMMHLASSYQNRLFRPESTLFVPSRFGDYTVTVGENLLQNVGNFFDLDRKVLLLTDENIPKPYIETVASACRTPVCFTMPDGEENKRFERLEEVLAVLQEHHFTRKDCLVAIGGGVVGDLGGLAAGLYLRGIDFYNIPTSLLAQVDASVGSKTAIDFGGAKNQVGLYNPPKAVLTDIALLQTLPRREWQNGMAEIIKTAALFSEKLFLQLEADEWDPAEVIRTCLKRKISIVRADECERDLRKVLNFGHTLGHGIELYTELTHGESVGIGMLPMCEGPVRARLRAVLEKYGLPTEIAGNVPAIMEIVRHDKKRENDEICAVTLSDIGKFSFEMMDEAQLTERLRTVIKEPCNE